MEKTHADTERTQNTEPRSFLCLNMINMVLYNLQIVNSEWILEVEDLLHPRVIEIFGATLLFLALHCNFAAKAKRQIIKLIVIILFQTQLVGVQSHCRCY